MLVWSKNFNTA